MSRRASRLTAVLLAVVGLVCVIRPVEATGKNIKPGDKVKVTIGPAPVREGGRTLTTVESGTILTAEEVKGNEVKVTVEKDGEKITGWIHNIHVNLAAPKPRAKPKAKPGTKPEAKPGTKPKAKPQTKPPGGAAARSAVPLTRREAKILYAALKKEHMPDTPKAQRDPAARGKVWVTVFQSTTTSKYGRMKLDLSGDEVECVNAGRGLTLSVDYGIGRRRVKSVKMDTKGVILVFPTSFRLGTTEFPARTLLRGRGRTWERITTPGAFEKVIAWMKRAAADEKSPEQENAAKALELFRLGARPRRAAPGEGPGRHRKD